LSQRNGVRAAIPVRFSSECAIKSEMKRIQACIDLRGALA
jgi:hypothetical protein